MLTGTAEADSAAHAMRLGAASLLHKPVDLPHLAAAVEQAAEQGDDNHERHHQ